MQTLARRGRSALLLRRHFTSSAAAGVPVQLVSLDRLAHQSKLQLQISDRARTNVEIIPVLAPSEFALKAFAGGDSSSINIGHDVFSVMQEGGSSADGSEPAAVKTVRITKNEPTGADQDTPLTLQLFIPHLIDLNLSVVNGSVSIEDKMEGDVKVVVGEGDIRANKLRGEDINMKTNSGTIDIASLIEGEKIKLAANGVHCKRLMSGVTEIKLSGSKTAGEPVDSEFGAIYSSACVVNSLSKGSLQVGSVHGYLRVTGEEMQKVHVHGVNGAIDVEDSGRSCDAVVHFDSWTSDASSSILVGGNVVVSVEPTAPIEVELHGSKITTDGCEFSESELDQLDVDYAIFSGALQAKEGGGGAPLAGTSGKINVGSAKNAAMRTSFFMNDDAAVSARQEDMASNAATRQTLPHTAQLPRLLVHATSGTVQLEQLDWMTKLKRKHLKQ